MARTDLVNSGLSVVKVIVLITERPIFGIVTVVDRRYPQAPNKAHIEPYFWQIGICH